MKAPAYRGAFEVDFACVGGGAATYVAYGIRQSWRCDGQLLLSDLETARGSTVRVAATAQERWTILVQKGHMANG